MFEERFNNIDQRFNQIDQRLDGLQTDMNAMKGEMKAEFAELRNHMGVLYEEALQRIADTREIPTTTSSKPLQSKDDLGRRLDPLEALLPVVQEHAAKLERHDAEIERLKRRRK